jgi:flagellar basal-body rod protein FlgB
MMDLINSVTNQLISKSLDGHLARQQAISTNIANAETPNFKHRDVDFQTSLQQALQQSRSSDESKLVATNAMPLPLQAKLPQHFGVLLQQEANPTSTAFNAVGVATSEEEGFQYRNDANGVDLEHEMVALAKNAGRFKAITKLQGRLNQQLKTVINSSGN